MPPTDANTDMCLYEFIAPTYAPIARQANIRGTVRLRVKLDSQGTPSEVTVLEEGHPILRESAVNAVKKWRFCAAGKTDEAHDIELIFIFKLEGKPTQSWLPTEVSFNSSGIVSITAPPATTLQY